MNDHPTENTTELELLQLRMDIRRALLEEADVPSPQEAFRQFRQAHAPSHADSHARLYWIGALAVAACLAALLVMRPWSISRTATEGQGLLVYQAATETTDVAVVVGDKPVALTSTTARQQGFYMNAEGEIHITTDTKVADEDRTTLLIPQGQLAQIVLDDGTRVWLSADSRLVFPRRFPGTGNREVALVGEGFFEVTPDASRPFVVDCGELRTTVLGTSFNVRAFAGETPSVTLLSGRVSVTHDSSTLTLAPDEQATLEGQQLRLATADPDVVTSWLHGEFYFDGQTLRQLMTELGRWYNVDVVFADTSHLNDRLHFGCKRSLPLTEVLSQLSLISGAHISHAKGTITVD